MTSQSGLELTDVRIAIGLRELVRLSVSVEPGEILTIVGPSGSGKSSLLGFVAGTLAPAFTASGDIVLDGQRLNAIGPEGRRVGLLFQDDLLFPHLSVGGNLAFGIPADVRGRAARRNLINATLAKANLGAFADRDPATLSGGQRARVALLRVLLSRPRALLLDEPFSKLDTVLREQFRSFVFAEVRAHRLPTILVTHDPEDRRAAAGPEMEIGISNALPQLRDSIQSTVAKEQA